MVKVSVLYFQWRGNREKCFPGKDVPQNSFTGRWCHRVGYLELETESTADGWGEKRWGEDKIG